nr:DUF2779 domain-containing protein [Candidatus Woesebacteria bacterium]
MPSRTQEAIASGADTILQGRFEAGGITCIFDVLQKVGDHEYDLIEIKSSTEVKEEHICDLAFQKIVLENAGIRIRKLFVIFVNNKYVKKGDIEIEKLTVREDVTEQVIESIPQTREDIKQALAVCTASSMPDPSPRHVRVGKIGEWLLIYETLVPGRQKYDIYDLCRPNAELIGELEDRGVQMISDIPDDVTLHPKQKAQVQATKASSQIVSRGEIHTFISELKYPLYFFDYETFSTVIPEFDGTHPYQQVPFQYSLHMMDEDGSISHAEYIHTENSNPGKDLLEQLRDNMGDTGSVLVWYKPFEMGRNKELAEMFPGYATFMNDVNDRIVDLMTPFSEGWFLDKKFMGSASIKKVLPVLISEFSYEKLDIQEGQTASRTWKELVLEGKHADKKEVLVRQLLEYCKMDTLAMVELFKYLEREVEE